jgi:prepilin-type processing-associated H-X9-DG protein
MSEKENSAKKKKIKICGLALSSLALGIFGFIYVLMGLPMTVDFLSAFTVAAFCLIGMVLGIVSLYRIWKSKLKIQGRVSAITGIVLNVLLICAILLFFNGSQRWQYLGRRAVCAGNLKDLGIAIHLYRDNNHNYPSVDNWCDLLQKQKELPIQVFKCPGDKNGPFSYAMNPNAEPNSPNDVVILFETKSGWNQFGGPELLDFDNHNGKGCNILFNDGHVEWVIKERIAELKWEVEENKESSSGNFRRSGNDEEMEYWLKNMVWYHKFTNDEISKATGLSKNKIIAALKKFNICPYNQPKRVEDAPLLVLPYPGGRHPRIGFLDGAIDPQRETKFSVFTPWDANSYVVVDVPEAIWSNLGLTYLAHTHIDTIWTKQGIELPKLEWNRYPDGTLDIERKLPNGITFGAKAKPTKEAVRMELWLKNGTKQKLSDLRVQICVMPKMAAGFEQQTNDNKVLTNPYVACRSKDGKRWIITAWEKCNNPWANERCPCFHSDPKFPDLEAGQTYRLHGWLSFYEGTDIEAEFNRIEATGWLEKQTSKGKTK